MLLISQNMLVTETILDEYLDILLLNITSKHVFMTQQKYLSTRQLARCFGAVRRISDNFTNVTERCCYTDTHTEREISARIHHVLTIFKQL